MSKNESDIQAFIDQWNKRGRDVRILDFSPDIILAEINGAFSAAELEQIAEFIRECEDK
jgi:hypothetical protein